MTTPERFLTGVFAILISVASTSATQDRTPADRERAVRAVAEQYAHALASGDVALAMSFWDVRADRFGAAETSLRERVANRQRPEFRNLESVVLRLMGSDAVVRVTADAGWTRTLRLLAEAGLWLVMNEMDAVSELAFAIAEMNTAEERKKSVADNKSRQTPALVTALLDEAIEFDIYGDLSRALGMYTLARDVGESIGDKEGTSLALLMIGVVHDTRGEANPAVAAAEQQLALQTASGDKAGIAMAASLLSQAYEMRGDYDSAMTYARQALVVYEQVADNRGIVVALGGMGHIDAALGNLESALASLERALLLSQATPQNGLTAGIRSSIGSIYQTRGDFARALEYFQTSGSGSFDALVNLAGLYRLQGDHAQALAHYRKALPLLTVPDLGQPRILALEGLAATHGAMGNAAEAQKVFEEALALSRTGNLRPSIASVLQGMGQVHFRHRRYDDALGRYLESLKVLEEMGDKQHLPELQQDIARAYLEQKNYAQALAFASRSTESAIRSGATFSVWQAHTVAGQALRALGQVAGARTSFEAAVAAIESSRTQVAGSMAQQQRFMEPRTVPYLAMVEMLVAAGQTGEALAFAERAKARVLADVLQRGRIDVTKTMTPLETSRERRFMNEQASLNAQVGSENEQPKPDQKRLAYLRAELEKLRLEHQAFRTSLYATHPELRIQRAEAPPIGLADAFGLVPNTGAALLEYVVTAERAYLFVLTRTGAGSAQRLGVYPIEISEDALAKRVEAFRSQIASLDLGFVAPSRELFNTLLRPAQEQLRGTTVWTIVPDGILWDLPFQALQSSAERYLIQDRVVSYAPSLTVLRAVMNARVASGRGTGDLLAFGNPVVGKTAEQRMRAVLMDADLVPLPEAERQVEDLGKLYGPERSRVYVRAEANEDRFKSDAWNFRILQFATHGILNAANPMYSYLALAPKEGDVRMGGTNQDGLLEAWEIMDLTLNADLVVLAACETARGRVGAGEGMIGMAWAFFVAGAPTTVASQWKVESRSTTELMLEFHRNLKARFDNPQAGMSKAKAMQLAAQKLLVSKDFKHPFYWAGFVVIGDGR